MPLGIDPRAVEKAIAAYTTTNLNLFIDARSDAMRLSSFKEMVRDCDNLHKLQAALIEAVETEIWTRDEGDGKPNEEIVVAVKRILED